MSGETSSRLALPLLQWGQAQKEMSHNEALVRLDLAVQAAVEAAELNSPPPTPAPGQAWIVGSDPDGAWASHAGAIAGWTGGGWRFVAPREGMVAWVGDARAFALFSEGGWTIGALHGRVFVDGEQVVGARSAPIADPSGGETIDTEARAALASLLAAVRAHGLVDTV